MTEFDNEMRGVLFLLPVEKRVARGPLYTGKCQVDGVEYRLAAWGNTSPKGTKYLSIRISIEGQDDKTPRRKVSRSDSQRPLEDDEEPAPRRNQGLEDDDPDKIPF